MPRRSNFIAPLFFWIFPALGITLLSGLIYASVQQNYRQSANDPQIQISEDAATSLSNGSLPILITGNSTPIDLSKSLAVFSIVYDSTGRALSSSGELNGTTPVPPSGVFDSVKAHGEDRLTWQPSSGVRIAAVINSYNSATNGTGFVLVGRSLREVENRENTLEKTVGLIWILILIIAYVGIFLLFNKVLYPRHRE